MLEHETASQCALNALRLLADLLEHEVGVAALLDRLQIPVHLVNSPAHRALREGEDLVTLGRQNGVVAVIEVYDLARVLDHCGRIRTREELPVGADTEEERTAVAGDHDLVRIAGADDGDPIRTLDLQKRGGDRVLEGPILLEGLIDQVHQRFRVRLRLEDVAELLELRTDGGGIFDDAVVHERDVLGPTPVRMRVHLVRRAVRGPTGVGDSA